MEIKVSIAKQIDEFLKEKGVESPFTLDIPKDKSHGDLTTNIALAISKKLGKNGRELATELKEYIENKKIEGLTSIEIAGAGFLNFKIDEDPLSTLNEIVSKDFEYGKEEKKNKKVMVEYGQPNTHKALQIGHMKSGLIGASIIKLLENSGYDVIKANYYSDVGKHVAKCMYGLLLDNNESIEESTNKVKEIEKESGVNDVAKYLNECYAKASSLYEVDEKAKEGIDKINLVIYSDLDKDTPLMNLYRLTKEMSEEHQNLVFGELGVVFDRQYPESEIFKDGLELVKKHTPDIFIPDQGAVIFPGEKYDLQRWVFITKEGVPTYSAKDLGLAHKKFEEYPDLNLSIVLTSVEQNAYFKAVIKALELIDKKFIGKYKHFGFGWMLLGNKKTSSRSGKTVKVTDLMEEIVSKAKEKISKDKNYTNEEIDSIAKSVGISALKFFVLSYEFHKDINYDPDKVLSLTGFSGPYIMYGYVRTHGILKESEIDKTKLSGHVLNQDEKELIQELSKYPNIAAKASEEFAPHKIAHYLYDLTNLFNKFYNNNQVLNDPVNKDFRLLLTKSVSIVLRNGLKLLNIDVVDRM